MTASSSELRSRLGSLRYPDGSTWNGYRNCTSSSGNSGSSSALVQQSMPTASVTLPVPQHQSQEKENNEREEEKRERWKENEAPRSVTPLPLPSGHVSSPRGALSTAVAASTATGEGELRSRTATDSRSVTWLRSLSSSPPPPTPPPQPLPSPSSLPSSTGGPSQVMRSFSPPPPHSHSHSIGAVAVSSLSSVRTKTTLQLWRCLYGTTPVSSVSAVVVGGGGAASSSAVEMPQVHENRVMTALSAEATPTSAFATVAGSLGHSLHRDEDTSTSTTLAVVRDGVGSAAATGVAPPTHVATASTSTTLTKRRRPPLESKMATTFSLMASSSSSSASSPSQTARSTAAPPRSSTTTAMAGRRMRGAPSSSPTPLSSPPPSSSSQQQQQHPLPVLSHSENSDTGRTYSLMSEEEEKEKGCTPSALPAPPPSISAVEEEEDGQDEGDDTNTGGSGTGQEVPETGSALPCGDSRFAQGAGSAVNGVRTASNGMDSVDTLSVPQAPTSTEELSVVEHYHRHPHQHRQQEQKGVHTPPAASPTGEDETTTVNASPSSFHTPPLRDAPGDAHSGHSSSSSFSHSPSSEAVLVGAVAMVVAPACEGANCTVPTAPATMAASEETRVMIPSTSMEAHTADDLLPTVASSELPSPSSQSWVDNAGSRVEAQSPSLTMTEAFVPAAATAANSVPWSTDGLVVSPSPAPRASQHTSANSNTSNEEEEEESAVEHYRGTPNSPYELPRRFSPPLPLSSRESSEHKKKKKDAAEDGKEGVQRGVHQNNEEDDNEDSTAVLAVSSSASPSHPSRFPRSPSMEEASFVSEELTRSARRLNGNADTPAATEWAGPSAVTPSPPPDGEAVGHEDDEERGCVPCGAPLVRQTPEVGKRSSFSSSPSSSCTSVHRTVFTAGEVGEEQARCAVDDDDDAVVGVDVEVTIHRGSPHHVSTSNGRGGRGSSGSGDSTGVVTVDMPLLDDPDFCLPGDSAVFDGEGGGGDWCCDPYGDGLFFVDAPRSSCDGREEEEEERREKHVVSTGNDDCDTVNAVTAVDEEKEETAMKPVRLCVGETAPLLGSSDWERRLATGATLTTAPLTVTTTTTTTTAVEAQRAKRNSSRSSRCQPRRSRHHQRLSIVCTTEEGDEDVDPSDEPHSHTKTEATQAASQRPYPKANCCSPSPSPVPPRKRARSSAAGGADAMDAECEEACELANGLVQSPFHSVPPSTAVADAEHTHLSQSVPTRTHLQWPHECSVEVRTTVGVDDLEEKKRSVTPPLPSQHGEERQEEEEEVEVVANDESESLVVAAAAVDRASHQHLSTKHVKADSLVQAVGSSSPSPPPQSSPPSSQLQQEQKAAPVTLSFPSAPSPPPQARAHTPLDGTATGSTSSFALSTSSLPSRTFVWADAADAMLAEQQQRLRRRGGEGEKAGAFQPHGVTTSAATTTTTTAALPLSQRTRGEADGNLLRVVQYNPSLSARARSAAALLYESREAVAPHSTESPPPNHQLCLTTASRSVPQPRHTSAASPPTQHDGPLDEQSADVRRDDSPSQHVQNDARQMKEPVLLLSASCSRSPVPSPAPQPPTAHPTRVPAPLGLPALVTTTAQNHSGPDDARRRGDGGSPSPLSPSTTADDGKGPAPPPTTHSRKVLRKLHPNRVAGGGGRGLGVKAGPCSQGGAHTMAAWSKHRRGGAETKAKGSTAATPNEFALPRTLSQEPLTATVGSTASAAPSSTAVVPSTLSPPSTTTTRTATPTAAVTGAWKTQTAGQKRKKTGATSQKVVVAAASVHVIKPKPGKWLSKRNN